MSKLTKLAKLKEKLQKDLAAKKAEPEAEEGKVVQEIKREQKELEKRKVKSAFLLVQNLTKKLAVNLENIQKYKEGVKKVELELSKAKLDKDEERDLTKAYKKLKANIQKLMEENISIQQKIDDLQLARGVEGRKIDIKVNLKTEREKKEDLIDQLSEIVKKLSIEKNEEKRKELETEKDAIESSLVMVENLIKKLEEQEAGIVGRGEGKEVSKLEKIILTKLKKIYEKEKRMIAGDEGEDVSNEFVLNSFEEIIDNLITDYSDEEDLEEYVTILKKFKKLTKPQILNFISLYLKRERDFFKIFDNYVESIRKYKPDDLANKSKKELLELVDRRNFPHDYSKRDTKFLTQLLLSQKCDPELDILCNKKGEVCDIEDKLCIPKPKNIPKNNLLKVYKGTNLYGESKKVLELYKRLSTFEKLEKEATRREMIAPPPPVKHSKTKFIDKEGNVISLDEEVVRERPDTEKLRKMVMEKTCLNDYIQRPWIKNYQPYRTYILNADGSKPDEKYLRSDVIQYNDEYYYRVNDLFNLLNCNRYQKDRKQEGDVTTLFGDDGTEMNVKIIHLNKSGEIIPQDQNLFKKEKEYLTKEIKDFKKKLDDYLEDDLSDPKISAIMRTIGYEEIFRRLKELYSTYIRSVTIEDEKLNNLIGDMASKIESNIRVNTNINNVEDYFRALSKILIWIDLSKAPLSDDIQAFQKRLVEGYYNLENLHTLKDEEILPIISGNILTNPQKREFYKIVDQDIDRNVYHLVRNMFYLLNKGSKSFSIQNFTKKPDYSSLDFLKRVDEVVDPEFEVYEEWELVTYLEDGKLYTFPIRHLIIDFLIGETENKYTGKQFDPSFVKRVLDIFELDFALEDPREMLKKKELEKVQLNEEKTKEMEEKNRIERENLEKLDSIILDKLSDKRPVELSQSEKEVQRELSKIFGFSIEQSFGKDEDEDEDLMIEEMDLESSISGDSDDEDEDEDDEDEDEDDEDDDEDEDEEDDEDGDDEDEEDDEDGDDEEEDKEDDEEDEEIVKEISEPEIESKDVEVCRQCDKELGEKFYKSVGKKDDSSEVLKFCSLECMEENSFRKRG